MCVLYLYNVNFSILAFISTVVIAIRSIIVRIWYVNGPVSKGHTYSQARLILNNQLTHK